MGELNLDSIEARCMREESIDWQTVKALVSRIRELERMNAVAYKNGVADGGKADDPYAKGWNDALRATDGKRAGVPEGWKLVPVEPTERMVEDAIHWRGDISDIRAGRKPAPISETRQQYRAMLAAAPTPDIGMTISPTPPAGDAGQERDDA